MGPSHMFVQVLILTFSVGLMVSWRICSVSPTSNHGFEPSKLWAVIVDPAASLNSNMGARAQVFLSFPQASLYSIGARRIAVRSSPSSVNRG